MKQENIMKQIQNNIFHESCGLMEEFRDSIYKIMREKLVLKIVRKVECPISDRIRNLREVIDRII